MPIFTLFIVCLFGSSVVNGAPPGQGRFKFITDGISFKAYYGVHAFAGERSIYSGDIYESYNSKLGTGIIRQISRESIGGEGREGGDGGLELETVIKFLYDSRARRLVEITQNQLDRGEADLFQDDFSLYENGGSNSYKADKLQYDIRKESIWLLPRGATLDSKLIFGHSYASQSSSSSSSVADKPELELDHFMPDQCLGMARERLHYINGITRLLHLIECRRKEFKLQTAQAANNTDAHHRHAEQTRGQTRLLYRATKLGPVSTTKTPTDNRIAELDLIVTVHHDKSSSSSSTAERPSQTLEPGQVPLSLVLAFEPGMGAVINLYQFESLDHEEGHLSESNSGSGSGGHSIYMMPLAQPNLAPLLSGAQYEQAGRELEQKPTTGVGLIQQPKQSFSFEALLTGSHLDKFYSDPIELLVSYDAQLGLFATKSTFTDRSRSDGLSGWSRSSIRQLYDAQSGLKFHQMSSNYGYVEDHMQEAGDSGEGGEGGEGLGSQAPVWRACASDKLTSNEAATLEGGSDGHLFGLAGATYMGEAIVRGIRCQVYERRLFELPTLLGIGHVQDHIHGGQHLVQSEVYLDLCAYGGGGRNDLSAPRFARLDFRFVSKLDRTQRRSITLDVSSFEWRPAHWATGSSEVWPGGENLLGRMVQECLLMVPGARHLDMELWLGLDGGEEQSPAAASSAQGSHKRSLLGELANNEEMRDESVREMLATSMGISLIQQVDLETEMLLPPPDQQNALSAYSSQMTSSRNHDHEDVGPIMRVKFSLYELWADAVQEEFIGYAKSLSLSAKFFNPRSLVAGTRSYSHAECKGRAVHSLQPDRTRSEYNRNDDEEDERHLRLFMFCPQRLVCILGDSTWTPMRRQRPLKLDHLLEYPYESPSSASVASSSSSNRNNIDHDDDVDDGEDPTKCVISSVLIKQQDTTSGPLKRLNWWLINGSQGAGRAADTLAQQRVRELSPELKVKLVPSNSGISNNNNDITNDYATTTDTGGGGGGERVDVLKVKVNRLKLSNRIFTTGNDQVGGNKSNGPARQQHENIWNSWNDVSLLIKPLVGLAYLSPGKRQQSSSSSNTTAAPSNHQSARQQQQQQQQQTIGAVISFEPLVVSSLAECSRACLQMHECRSFSACHLQQQERRGKQVAGALVSCVLSRLSWSNELEFHQLVRLTTLTQGSDRALNLEVNSPPQVTPGYIIDYDNEKLPDESSQVAAAAAASAAVSRVQVQFERSPLCSLRARAQMDLYRMVMSHLDTQPAPQYLIPVNSLEHCARLCQERAQLMRELSLAKANKKGDSNNNNNNTAGGLGAAFRNAACHEFRYSVEMSYCQLLPLQNHWANLGLEHLLQTAGSGNNSKGTSWQEASAASKTGGLGAAEGNESKLASLPTLNKWLGWFKWLATHGLDEWLRQLRQTLNEADHYELDFEQIFLAQRNRRLELTKERQANATTKTTTTTSNGQDDDDDWIDGTKPQVSFSQYSLYACAKRCLQYKGCRSFDVQLLISRGGAGAGGSSSGSKGNKTTWPTKTPATSGHGQQRVKLCLLNVISAADLGANPSGWPTFKLKQFSITPDDSTEWWHYEPSELALFMITDPSEEVSTAVAAAAAAPVTSDGASKPA